MKKKVLSLVLVLVLAVVLVFPALPVGATVANPDSISLPSVAVFDNVYVTGDQLFVIETDPAYASVPTLPASSTFFVAIMDPTGVTVEATRTLDYYNHYFSAIYLTPLQALPWGLAYRIVLSGNPAYFASLTPGVNQIIYTLSSAQWIDGTLGSTGSTPYLLQSWCIRLATACNPGWLDANSMLNATGTVIFLTEIQALGSVCPGLFEVSASSPGFTPGTASKTEEQALTARQGPRLQKAMTDLGVWMGMGPTLGGPILETVCIAILCFMVAGGVFVGTGSTAMAVVVGVIPTIFAGNMIGLLPLTLTFVLAFLVVLTFGITFILSHM
jgi:hypothetical protein